MTHVTHDPRRDPWSMWPEIHLTRDPHVPRDSRDPRDPWLTWPVTHVTRDPCDPWHMWPMTHIIHDPRDLWSMTSALTELAVNYRMLSVIKWRLNMRLFFFQKYHRYRPIDYLLGVIWKCNRDFVIFRATFFIAAYLWSVRLSVLHTRDIRPNGSKYRHILCAV